MTLFNTRTRCLHGCLLLAVILSSILAAPVAQAAGASHWQTATDIRNALFEGQKALLAGELDSAQSDLVDARELYRASSLPGSFADLSGNVDDAIMGAFDDAQAAVSAGDLAAFSLARGRLWSALLEGAYRAAQLAIQNSQAGEARPWLLLREYRPTTRFSRPEADATLALAALADGEMQPEEALEHYRADLLDTYQALLASTLGEVTQAGELGFGYRQAESVGLVSGYWRILRDAYVEQFGEAAALEADAYFAHLQAAERAEQGDELVLAIADINGLLNSFRAAPLTAEEQARRAGQMLRFLSLVPVEYGRGVSNGQVLQDLEVQEAITFLDGAQAAFQDLRLELDALDATAAAWAAAQMDAIDRQLQEASQHENVVAPEVISAGIDEVKQILTEMAPEAWLASNTDSDLDVLASVLDQMEAAVAQGLYDQAESARLEAYAIFDTGLEPRLLAFAPDVGAEIEALFWQGSGDQEGLGNAIALEASHTEIVTIRQRVDEVLVEAQQILGEAPTATPVIITNAAVIVFREGLEAVIILAALIAGMAGAYQRFRKPLAAGAGVAMLATVATWWVAQGILLQFRGFGERLEAVVSVIAVVVLLLITNWFFHKTYWTGWLAGFHQRKRGLLNEETGQILGLIALGFSSIYREGFETVLFLQALVLDAGSAVVLQGVLLGLVGVVIIGYLIFRMQSRLPYMKLLVATGVLIGGVMLVLVGKTVHVLQAVGWLPITPISGLSLPYWLGLWFGVFPTWLGIIAQIASVAFVLGSYYLAEHLRKRRRDERQQGPSAQPVD